MVEATADSEGALADGGILEAGSKLAASKAAHAAGVALRAEPRAAWGRQPGQPDAGRMVRSQTGPAACNHACTFPQYTK